LILDHIEELSEATGQDLMSWDENENRFEVNELKWLGDFVVGNLVFIRKELKITDQEKSAYIMEVLWKTLALLEEHQGDLQQALGLRV
jgi:hypothetical protein